MTIRWLGPEDAEQFAALQQEKGEGLDIPKGTMLAGAFKDGKLVSVLGVVRPLVIDYALSCDHSALKSLIAWMDGKTDPEPYYAFLSNSRLSSIIQLEYGDAAEQFDGKLLVRRR